MWPWEGENTASLFGVSVYVYCTAQISINRLMFASPINKQNDTWVRVNKLIRPTSIPSNTLNDLDTRAHLSKYKVPVYPPTQLHKHTERRQRESDDKDEYLCIITAVALQGAALLPTWRLHFPSLLRGSAKWWLTARNLAEPLMSSGTPSQLWVSLAVWAPVQQRHHQQAPEVKGWLEGTKSNC